jgi:hypothetical protein
VIGAGYGHISKQGNALLRFLLVECARVTVRSDPLRKLNANDHLVAPTGYSSRIALILPGKVPCLTHPDWPQATLHGCDFVVDEATHNLRDESPPRK